MAKTIHDYVRYLRDNIFSGTASAVYIYDASDLAEFMRHPPDPKLENIPVPPTDQVEWPIAVVYNNEIYWVDSSGNLWGIPDGGLVEIKSKEWIPVE